jgi:hypothetical protein
LVETVLGGQVSFFDARKLQPGSAEARKGLGYVNLWQGNGTVAIDYFEKLVLDYPRDIEFYIALAQSYLVENQLKNARIALRSALKLDSTSRVASQLLQSTYGIAAPLELDVWVGYSQANNMDAFNIRTVQLTGQVSKKLRMFLKYDNSLSLDLSSLVRAEQGAQAFSVGALLPMSKVLTSKFEYGTRILPEGITQQVFSTEQVVFVSKHLSLKAGGFFLARATNSAMNGSLTAVSECQLPSYTPSNPTISIPGWKMLRAPKIALC